jgi:antitoxin MazE
MRARIERWGSSLVLRIPDSMAAEVNLEPDTLVELSLVAGNLVVVPLPKAEVTLQQLVDGITDQNLHREVETGPPTGKEVW